MSEMTSRAIEMMSRVGADEGRGKAEGVCSRLGDYRVLPPL